MTYPHFFGYGSLVNRATHTYPEARTAQLTGWRRAWCHTDARPAAYLTAIPDPGCVIDGLIAAVPEADWAALDLRESAYDRIPVTGAVLHARPSVPEIAVYSVRAPQLEFGPNRGAILLSYLDVVVQGYLREFGPDGVGGFFTTTSGWDTPILNDRAAPLYPRAQRLSAAETACVDGFLDRMGIIPVAA